MYSRHLHVSRQQQLSSSSTRAMRTPWSDDRVESKQQQVHLQKSRGQSGFCWRMRWEQTSDDKGSRMGVSSRAGYHWGFCGIAHEQSEI